MNNKFIKNSYSVPPIKNVFTITIPYVYLISATVLSISILIMGLFYAYLKLKISKNSILMIESKYNHLEKLVTDLSIQNDRLITLIEELKIKNVEFSNIIQNLKIENDILLKKIDHIKYVEDMGTVVNSTTSPLIIKTVIIFTAVSVTLVGGYFVTSYIASKLASTSIGLLVHGINTHLKVFSSKLGIIKTVDSYVFLDSTNRKYVVDVSNTPELFKIQIETQGQLVDIGSYISQLLENIVNNPIVEKINIGVNTDFDVDTAVSAVLDATVSVASDVAVASLPLIENTDVVKAALDACGYA